MKIIDKTPRQDDKGNISIIGRILGTIKNGFSWYAEMESQKAVVAQLDRALEKSFVLIRNFNLPGSDIVIPLVLIGLGGVYIIHVTPDKGSFEAKGDQWNITDKSGNSQPARVNLLNRLMRLTRAFQKYLEISKIALPTSIEPILIAINPGAHIESMRPAVKIFKSDTIKIFINTLLQAPPIWRSEQLYSLADRIVEPRLRQESEPVTPLKPAETSTPFNTSRFEDSGPAKPFDVNDLGFSFEEESAAKPVKPISAPAANAQPQPANAKRPRAAPVKRKILGMSGTQATLVIGLISFWLCTMTVFAVLYLNQ